MSTFEPRYYQKDAFSAVVRSIAAGNRRPLVVMPVGAGKSPTMGMIAKSAKARTLFVAHREELIEQNAAKIEWCSGIRPGIEKADRYAAPDDHLVVASVQTIQRGRVPAGAAFANLIIDEAHHATAKSYANLIEAIGPAYVVGFTATPFRGDAAKLSDVFDDIAYEISMIELIERGYLADIRTAELPVKINLDTIRISAGDYSKSDLADAIRPQIGAIARTFAAQYGHLKTLAFCPLVGTSQLLAEELSVLGIETQHIDEKTDDRRGVLARYGKAQSGVLTNGTLLVEGYDEPTIQVILDLRPTRSRVLEVQKTGRGTRPHESKDHLIIVRPKFSGGPRQPVTTACLVARDEIEAECIDKRLSQGELLSEAYRLAADDRKKALAQALRRGRSAKQITRGALALCLDAPDLETWVPTVGWHRLPPSDGQLQMLVRRGLNPAMFKERGFASAVIDKMMQRQNQELATIKQVAYLYSRGIEGAEIMTFRQASDCIGLLKSGVKP